MEGTEDMVVVFFSKLPGAFTLLQILNIVTFLLQPKASGEGERSSMGVAEKIVSSMSPVVPLSLKGGAKRHLSRI